MNFIGILLTDNIIHMMQVTGGKCVGCGFSDWVGFSRGDEEASEHCHTQQLTHQYCVTCDVIVAADTAMSNEHRKDAAAR